MYHRQQHSAATAADGRDFSLEDLRVFRRSRSCGPSIVVGGQGRRGSSSSRQAARGAALVISSVRDDEEVAMEVKG